MRLKKNFRFFVPLMILLVIYPAGLTCQEKQEYYNIQDAILSSVILKGKSGPVNVNWINNGALYTYTVRNYSTNHKEIREYNPETLEDKLILDVDELRVPSTGRRFNYKSFKWAKDSRHIMFQTNFRKIYRHSGISDYYIFSFEDRSLKLLVKDARTAELSPDGTMVGYERDGNMFVYNIKDRAEKQLTFDATGSIYNGHFDWVYEEEFGIAKAWNWSPDSKYIAFWQLDESDEPLFQMTNYEGQHPEYVKFRVPLVGDKNARVKIGVVNVKDGTRSWLNSDDEYIPRIYWISEPNRLAMITLNRKQNDMKLYFFDVTSGSKKLILEEKSDTWIDIHNFYERVNDMIYFPDHWKEFFWLSDRDGYQHIYRYDYSGKLLNKITKGNWTVTRIEGINSETGIIYYSSTEVSPLERHLYSIKFDGSGKRKLSKEEGRHRINLSPNTKYYIDSCSNTHRPKQVELWSTDGKMLAKLQDNKSVSVFLNNHKYSPAVIFSFTTRDGTKLDGRMIKPFDFDSTKEYPVVFHIYGGPNSQEVYNEFATDGWDQWLAQQGYLVVNVNNRGNANYGRNFMKIVYEHLGKWESNDFSETLRYLSGLPYVDTSKTAIMGTSYGGYSTIYTMLTHPGVFKVGIANSPVTDWLLYDDIYTERYMGLKDENKNGYEESSTLDKAENLRGKLLIVHSTMDDNVHVQNTMQLLTALTNAGKDADLRIYPLGAHGAKYNFVSQILMLNVYNDFLARYLKSK
jgi:dipeptidyl-peptidase-4